MSTYSVGPYINFQGHAREAMEYYQSVLGGALDLHTVNEQGVASPARPGDNIAQARLVADGVLLVATDGHPKYPPTVGEHMAIALSGTDSDRITDIFNTLAEGGKLKGKLTEQPWGGKTGYLTDKFGVNWVVSIEQA
ncbi:MAG: VOC family protein [Ktedonobacterales bacterium]